MMTNELDLADFSSEKTRTEQLRQAFATISGNRIHGHIDAAAGRPPPGHFKPNRNSISPALPICCSTESSAVSPCTELELMATDGHGAAGIEQPAGGEIARAWTPSGFDKHNGAAPR